jgi:hypothetical protein
MYLIICRSNVALLDECSDDRLWCLGWSYDDLGGRVVGMCIVIIIEVVGGFVLGQVAVQFSRLVAVLVWCP